MQKLLLIILSFIQLHVIFDGLLYDVIVISNISGLRLTELSMMQHITMKIILLARAALITIRLIKAVYIFNTAI